MASLLLGGFALGARALARRAGPPAAPDAAPTAGLGAAYLSALGLTIANPSTILSFGAVFAGLGLSARNGAGPAAALVLGVLVGSAGWWLVLATAVALLRDRVTAPMVRVVGALSAVAILAFGLLAIASALLG